MDDCDDCRRAGCSGEFGWWGGYHQHCDSCMARICARSLAAFHALDRKHGNGDAEPLRDLIRHVLPAIPYTQARQLVWEWWQIDHGMKAPHADT